MFLECLPFPLLKLGEAFVSSVKQAKSVAHRGLLVARWFGDIFEEKIWLMLLQTRQVEQDEMKEENSVSVVVEDIKVSETVQKGLFY